MLHGKCDPPHPHHKQFKLVKREVPSHANCMGRCTHIQKRRSMCITLTTIRLPVGQTLNFNFALVGSTISHACHFDRDAHLKSPPRALWEMFKAHMWRLGLLTCMVSLGMAAADFKRFWRRVMAARSFTEVTLWRLIVSHR